MSSPKSILRPVVGLTRDVGLLVAGLEEVRAQTIALIADMTPDEMAVRITPEFHQAGSLALHLAETEFWWVEVVYAKKELTEEDSKFAHLNDTTETDFVLKGYDAEQCIEAIVAVHQRVLETLSGANDDELDAEMDLSPHPTRRRGSLRWILHHLIDHEAHHKGQIALMKRLIRGHGR